MRKPTVWTALIVCGLAALPASAGIDRIKSGPSCYGNCELRGYRAKVRRGLTYTWVFTGFGLQGADRVVTGGNGITGRVLTKSLSEVTVFLQLAATTPLGGRAITVQAGTDVLGAFAIEVGHLGRVDSVSPTSIVTGRRSVVRILGKDIRGGEHDPFTAALNARVVSRSADEIQIEFSPASTFSGTGVLIQLYERHGDGGRTPWQKAPRVAIQTSLATGGEGCQPYAPTDVYIKPKLSAPGSGYLFAPLTGTQTLRQVTFSWQRLTNDRTVDKFLLEHRQRGAPAWTTATVPASSTSHSVNLPRGIWEWRVRIGNCGQSAPYSDTWSFTIQ
jgi:hypothetical protein